MKTVALGTRLQAGAFGGGNQFARALTAYLQAQGCTVTHDLTHPTLDVILVTSVKPWARGTTFDIAAASQYATRHPHTTVILRVNECDERKGNRTGLLNALLRTGMRQADHTVFVSAWLQRTLLGGHDRLRPATSVITSGADSTIFNTTGAARWNGQEPLNIVTHHWSSSWYKGWDIYQALDDFLGTPDGRAFRFTFIGNPWPGARLRHTTVLPPESGQALAHLLKQHHVYVSGSQHEPAGMHYVEALACGLPVLWRHSGSLPEYCAGYGVGFTGADDVVPALQQLRAEYEHWRAATARHTYTADDMCRQYLKLFASLQRQSLPQRSLIPLRLRQGAVWLRDSLS